MNVKCTSTTVTVCPPYGSSYDRDLSYLITKGNVYEILEDMGGRYRIMHDHGDQTSIFPSYLFDKTDEPITENHNREKEIKEADERHRQMIKKLEADQEQQRINDNMERFYNPEGFREIERKRAERRRILSNIFVGGLPYDNY